MTQIKSSVEARLIKKYPNRRLYDTQTSTYITLHDIKQLVLNFEGFKVIDAKTSEDLTRSILLQIILEQENKEYPIFSAEMLSQIIRFYGHTLQGMIGSYLEKNLQAFVDIQNRMADQTKNFYSGQTVEEWVSFINMQSPLLQNMVNQYIDQSKSMFIQMQDQLRNQNHSLFNPFLFMSNETKPKESD